MSIVHTVYLLECQGIYKVGYAKDLQSRISAIQTSNPFPVEIVDSFPSDFPAIDEEKIHDKLRKYHQRGEWFKIPASWIKNRSDWFRTYSEIHPADQEPQDQSIVKSVTFARQFFAPKNLKGVLGVNNDTDLNIVVGIIDESDDGDKIYNDAINRSYEAFLRQELTPQQARQQVNDLIKKYG